MFTYGLPGVPVLSDGGPMAPRVRFLPTKPKTVPVPTYTMEELERISEAKNPPPKETVIDAPKVMLPTKTTAVTTAKVEAPKVEAAPITFPADFTTKDKVAIIEQLSDGFTPKQVDTLIEQVAPEIKKDDVEWLSDIAQKIAPKILAATVIGGDKEDREVLKANINNEAFTPIYEKFGDFAEKNITTAVAVGGAILGGLSGGIGSKTSAPELPMNIAPNRTLAGNSGSSAGPSFTVALLILAGTMVLFQSGIKKLFK